MRNKKRSVLMALCVLLSWLSFVVDGAHALLIDTTSLTGNAITTGTTDLLISNSQNPSSTVYEETRPGFTLSLTPGVPVEKYFLIKNSSPSEVDMDIDAYVVTPIPPPGSLADSVNIKLEPVDSTGTAIGPVISTSLASLRASHSAVFGQVPRNTFTRFKITTTLSNGYSLQNQEMTYDLIFTGTQHLGS